MNNMTILGLSSFSKPDAVVQINYLNFLKKIINPEYKARIHKAIDKYSRLH
jgi:hypothetical protein